MRALDDEEQAMMRALDVGVPTSGLVEMATGLSEILRGRGLVIQARLVEAMAERLATLEAVAKA